MITLTTDIEQDHPIHDPLTLILEQHRLSMTAIRAVQIVCSTQCWIFHQIVDDTRLFFCDGHQVVAIDERFSGFLLIVAIATGVEEDVICTIDFRV